MNEKTKPKILNLESNIKVNIVLNENTSFFFLLVWITNNSQICENINI
jgi:hypothetical protein